MTSLEKTCNNVNASYNKTDRSEKRNKTRFKHFNFFYTEKVKLGRLYKPKTVSLFNKLEVLQKSNYKCLWMSIQQYLLCLFDFI